MSAQDKYSLQERGRFKAWWDAARPLEGSAFPYEIAWAAWQAALSAQPSPGGQDALRVIAERLRGAGASLPAPPITGTIEGSMVTGLSIAPALVEEALAARQPSKQPDSVALGEATEFCTEKGDRQPVGQEPIGFQFRSRQWSDEEFAGPWLNPNVPNRAHYDSRPANYETRSIYAAPPAQAVDLGLQLDRYDAGLLGDGGGGDVGWWQDYIRAELDRAHEFYQDQADAHG